MWTVAGLERDLVVMVGPFLYRAGLDHETSDGTNESLRIPIRKASKRMGLEVAGSAVTDAELVPLDSADDEALLDLAQLRTLELCRDNWAEFDQSDGEESQQMSQLTKALDDRIAALEKKLGPLAVEEDSSLLPGRAVASMIREGLCYPPGGLGMNRYGYPVGLYYGSGGRLCP
jgi:hypothetical protein